MLCVGNGQFTLGGLDPSPFALGDFSVNSINLGVYKCEFLLLFELIKEGNTYLWILTC